MPKSSLAPLGPQRVESRAYEEGDERPAQPQERIAHALEYIAQQMDAMRKEMRAVIERLDALASHQKQ